MKPEKKRQKILIWLKNLSMATAVVVIVWLLVFLTQGWTLDSSGETRQTGLVQFASLPTGATIEVGSKALFEKSNAKALLLPGEYEFKMWRDGYETWFNRSRVRSGEILWLNYARLVPKKREVSNFFSIKNLKLAVASPSRQRILAISEDQSLNARFWLVDLRSDEPRMSEINFDRSIFGLQPSSESGQNVSAANLEISQISQSGERALLKVKSGDSWQWVVLNLDNPQASVNLSREFHLDFSQIKSLDENMNRFVAVNNHDLRILDFGSRTISAAFLNGVVDFEVFNHEVATFVRRSGDEFSVGLWRVGEKNSEIITSVKSQPKLAVARYYGDNYLHLSLDKQIRIFKGRDWFGDQKLKQIKQLDVPFVVYNLKTNIEGRMIMASNGQATFVYDLELKNSHELDFNSTKNHDPQMLDDFIFYDFEAGKLLIKDFNGENKHFLMPAEADFPAVLQPSGKYIFSFSKKSTGDFQISRLKMIL